MPSDRAISATRFDGGTVVQAFPLGGRVAVVEIDDTVPVTLDTALLDKTSLVFLDIPAGIVLYVGNAGQVGALEGDAARAVMFPLRPSQFPASIVDAEEDGVVFLGSVGFTLKILQAATLGQEI